MRMFFYAVSQLIVSQCPTVQSIKFLITKLLQICRKMRLEQDFLKRTKLGFSEYQKDI